MKKLLALVLGLSLLTGCASNKTEGDKETEETTTTTGTEEVTPEETSYTDGVYEAETNGNNGPVKVSVEIAENKIVKVEVLEHTETEGLADPAITDVPAAIVEKNSTDVDTVSGATVTSQAIIDAVKNCLEQATAK